MAVVDNAVPKNSQNPDDNSNNNNANKDNDLYDSSKPSKDGVAVVVNSKDSNFDHHHSQSNGDHSVNGSFDHHSNGFDVDRQHHVVGGGESNGRGTTATGANQIQIQNQRTTPTGNGHGLEDMSDLAEILSNLNPMAKEFVPPSLSHNNNGHHAATAAAAAAFLANGFPANYVPLADHGAPNGFPSRKKKNNFGQGRRRMNTRTSMAQREEIIRKTVYVSDIDQQVTEEQLASLFIHCGQVVDCRICGDPNSILRFAFVEFTDEDSARAALNLSGTMLGFYPLRVLPSKTAIAPVNPTFLPRSEDEREMCARTVYCTNIDKKIPQAELRLFFESFCGEVHRLRLLGDYHHSTRIAFVEFVMAESAIAALNCSGAVLGTLPIRVSPSKTPVRPRIPRSPMH